MQRLSVYLDPPLLAQARGGTLPVVQVLAASAAARGGTFRLHCNTERERLRSATRPGLAVFYRSDPFHARALCLRHAYCGPFWRLERGSDRSKFSVARARFDPDNVEPTRARNFAAKLRADSFRHVPSHDPEGHVYVPLQANLLERRRFQSSSPLDMIRTVLGHFPTRRIILAPHPGAPLTEVERNAIDQILSRHGNLSVQTAPAEVLLDGASVVVTQTSAVGFLALVAQIPVVLFGEIDYHHVAASVPRDGVAEAFSAPAESALTYDRYVQWFLTRHSFRDDRSPDALLRLLDRRGWRAPSCHSIVAAGC